MNNDEYIELGLNGVAPLKIIMRGNVIENQGSKVGVVSVVFATMDKALARENLTSLIEANKNDDYYMVYSVPLDTDLTQLEHFPSVVITKEDLSETD